MQGPSLKISIFSGHSGGHLFPALAFAEAFREKFPQSQLELITSRKGRAVTSQPDFRIFQKIVFLPEFPFPEKISTKRCRELKVPGTVFFFAGLLQGFFLSLCYLIQTRPQLCVGFGSYVSFPGMYLAKRLHIPTLIHEQNVVPGKASAWLSRHVDLVAVAFEETFSKISLKRRTTIGLPLRRRLVQSSPLHTPERKGGESRFQLLVVGGSQGAKRLNQLVAKCFSQFSSEEKEKIAVTHLTGSADYEQVAKAYQKEGIQADVFPFATEMQDLYGRTDLAITRSGANTLFELAYFKIPAIVVPYPHAEAHQAANAQIFASRGAILCCDEKGLTGEWLSENIRRFMREPAQRKRMAEKISQFGTPEAAEHLVQLAVRLLEEKKSWVLSTET